MFDHIIIRQEHDLRGRTEEGINSIILQGIIESGRDVGYEFISEETKAIKRAIDMAKDGDLIVALSDQYHSVVDAIRHELEKVKTTNEKTHKNKGTFVPTYNLKGNYHGKTA